MNYRIDIIIFSITLTICLALTSADKWTSLLDAGVELQSTTNDVPAHAYSGDETFVDAATYQAWIQN